MSRNQIVGLSTSVISIVRVVGALLLAHAFVVAISSKDLLKPHLHNVEGTDFALDTKLAAPVSTSGLPFFASIETLIGAILVIASQSLLAAGSLMKIRRKEVAGNVGRYDHATFSGIDFVHFQHRGAANSQK